MAERPEDLNLPNAVITRIIKEAVSAEIRHLSQARGRKNTFTQILALKSSMMFI